MARLDGRRLSWLRLLLLVGIITSTAFVGMSGWRWFQDTQAAADGREWFGPYVDATVTPRLDFEEPANSAGKDVVLSFVVADKEDKCKPSWGAAYSLDDASRDLDLDRRIARLRQQKGSVVVSFGGAANDELATACTDPTKLAKAYTDVIERYDLKTIDLDIEGAGLTDAAVNVRRAEAIRQVQNERAADKKVAVWLTLPVAPSGLTTEGRQAVSSMLDAKVDLAGVNLMTMDFGGSRAKGQSMADASIEALNSTHGQLQSLYGAAGKGMGPASLWKRMGATPMIGQNDVAGEVFDLKAAQELNQFAASKGLGRISMWSLNRDQACGPNYPDVTLVSNSCSGVAQSGTTFAQTLRLGVKGSPDGGAPSPVASSQAPSAEQTDDPATSPYRIWSADQVYVGGTRVVWHRNAYVAKYWTLGDAPDNPVSDASASPWRLLGPVLPGETPDRVPTLPKDTYPAWTNTEVYRKGDRVMLDGIGFSAKWYTQGDSPDARSTQTDPSPWEQLSDAEVRKIAAAANK